MTEYKRPFTQESFQALIEKKQTELNEEIARLQASGDIAALKPATQKFREEIGELTQQFHEDIANNPPVASSMPSFENNTIDKDTTFDEERVEESFSVRSDFDAVPQDDECAHLMLLGAMYVEENFMLDHMCERYDEAELQKNGRSIQTEFFSSLDMNITDMPSEEILQVLNESWGIGSIEALKNMLSWLLKEGHNKELVDLIRYCEFQPVAESRSLIEFRELNNNPLAFNDYSEKEFSDTCLMAESFKHELNGSSIWAWDAARYVHLLHLGYMSSLMSSKDCWIFLKRLLEPTKKHFNSWEEYTHSYIQGYRWWSGTSGPIEDACYRLLNHPYSPWLHFGWFSAPENVH